MMHRYRINGLITVVNVFVLVCLLGCTPGTADDPASGSEPWRSDPEQRAAVFSDLLQDKSEAYFDTVMTGLSGVVVDPPPRVGEAYFPEFPPDLPFNPDEWLTNTPSPSVGDPRAVKGGTIRFAMEDFPPTIRTEGANSRLSTLTTIHRMIYERLLDFDYAIGDFVPWLATHWQISEDRKTFRFRLNPDARWADGRPLTADDVAATFEHYRNLDRKDPALARTYDELIDHVTVLDRLTVEIGVTEPRWRTMIQIISSQIYPAAYIRMDGETYLTEWNWKLPPGTGPYELNSEDIRKGRSITLRRRKDYWGENLPNNIGRYNFETIRFDVVRDSELMYQKLLAGELDMFQVLTAQRWVTELDREEVVQKGWVQKRRIWNLDPNGYGGYCLNMRMPPFDNRNVRLAFAHLFNRAKLFAKYFYYQYGYMDSYYPGQTWARPDHTPVRFNPAEARRLLTSEGWTRNDAGDLANSREELFPKIVLEVEDADPSSMRIHNLYKDDLWREAGIRMELKQVDPTSYLKKIWDQKFQLAYWFWTASMFPDPEFEFHSKYAKQTQSNNLNGLAIPELDALLEAYRTEFDAKKRIEMLQQMDGLIFDAHPYVLAWFSPTTRILYWDKFGHPPEYSSRYNPVSDDVFIYWWYDETRHRKTERNQSMGVSNYPGKPFGQEAELEQDYWMNHALPRPDTSEEVSP